MQNDIDFNVDFNSTLSLVYVDMTKKFMIVVLTLIVPNTIWYIIHHKFSVILTL